MRGAAGARTKTRGAREAWEAPAARKERGPGGAGGGAREGTKK